MRIAAHRSGHTSIKQAGGELRVKNLAKLKREARGEGGSWYLTQPKQRNNMQHQSIQQQQHYNPVFQKNK